MKVPPRWFRRILGPGLLVVLVAAVLALPVLLFVAVVASPFLPGRLRGLRLVCFGFVWLAVETAAMIAAFGLWIAGGFGWQSGARWYAQAHYTLLRWCLQALVASGSRLFKLTLVTDDLSWSPLDDGIPGSDNAMVVLGRHAGPGDSLLLLETLMNQDHLRRPRVVMRDTMALDPTVDVFFHRLPSRFIDPTPGAGDDVIAEIGRLAEGLGSEDALLLFPEGGNFTPGRRVRAIERLRERGHEQYAQRAEGMEHVLAPKPGGLLAVLDAAPHADVVFVAHTGLEHIDGFRNLWRTIPDHKTLHLRWWFFEADRVPTGHEERIDWLFDIWEEMNNWIESHQD